MINLLAVSFLAFVSGGVTIFLDVQPVTGYLQKTAMVAYYVYKSGVEGEAIEPVWDNANSYFEFGFGGGRLSFVRLATDRP